nr:MAG TPA: hypothetical protein [Bacteriophage sp.]
MIGSNRKLNILEHQLQSAKWHICRESRISKI